MSTSVLNLVVDNRPVGDDDPVTTVPVAGRATVSTVPLTVATSPDQLTAAIASAMSLFGRCQVERTGAVKPFSNGRWMEAS